MSKMYRMERKIILKHLIKKESSLNRMKPDIIHISPAKSMKGEIYRKFLEEKEIFMSANNELTINIIKGCI